MNKELLRHKILEKYPLLNQVYIADYCYNYDDLKSKLGKTAGFAFEEIISKLKYPKIGIGGGSTIYSMIDSLKERPREIHVYPTAIIGRGPEINHVDSSFLTNLLYLKSLPLSKGFSLNLPPLPKNKEKAISFIETVNTIDEIKWLKTAICDLDCCFVGAGAVMPTGDFDDESNKLGLNFNVLKKNNVIGGINYNWFTSDGKQFGDYFITIPISSLQLMASSTDKFVVLIAGGIHKLKVIETAIRNSMLNVLVTDLNTSKKLLET